MKILPCNNVIQNGKKIQRFVERHAEISERKLLESKLQEMEELKAEIEVLEEKTADESLSEPVVTDEDYFANFFNEFYEDENDTIIQGQDDKIVTITPVNNTAIRNNTRIENNELEEDNKGCDGPEFDEFYGEFCPQEHRIKRDATGDFLGGMVETGTNLLMGNIGGSITSFLKTVARPIYHYFIQSDNDPAMERFTNRFVPETNFHGASNSVIMKGAIEAGDGGRVWDTMNYNSEDWNPRSSWTHIMDRSQTEKNAFKKEIPAILAVDKTISRRLKDVSLVITTLSTSLHDTTVEGMNKGFESASDSLKNIEGDNRSFIKLLEKLIDISRSDMPTDVEITAIIVIVILIISQVGLGFWQNRNTQLRIKSAVKNMGQKLEDIQQVIKDSDDKKARMKKQAEDKTQDRKQLGIELSSVIAKAVEQTINRAIEGTKRNTSLNFQNNRASIRSRAADQTRAGPKFKGNSVLYDEVGLNPIALLNNGH